MKPNKPGSRLTILAAVTGGCAVVAMGTVNAALSDESRGSIVSDPGTFTAPATTEMTTGETTKSSSSEGTVSPPSASPPVTATTPTPP